MSERTTTNDAAVAPEAMTALMRHYRVTRAFAPTPISHADLKGVLEAAYWAPSGGNRRPVRIIASTDRRVVRDCVSIAPGIYGRPPAVLLLCLDWSRAPHIPREKPRETDSIYLDVGSALAHVLLMGETAGLGMCPVMSFHRASMRLAMDVPPDWTPVIMVIVGHKQTRKDHPAMTSSKAAPSLDGYVTWREEPMVSPGGSADNGRASADPIPADDVRRALSEVALFCAAAAHGNVLEHASYAPVRLLQGVQRVTQALDDLGLLGSELSELGERIGVESIRLMKDHDRVRALADEALELLTGNEGRGEPL